MQNAWGKRVAAMVLAGILAVSLAGCRRKASATEPVGVNFSCRVEAEYRDMAVVAKLTRHSAGTLELEFEQPATLAGMAARWDGEQVQLSLLGLQFSVDPQTVPEGALGQEIVAALDAALSGEGERGKAENGSFVIRGNGQAGAYELVCDAATGLPQSLTVPSLPLRATFSDVKVTTEQ